MPASAQGTPNLSILSDQPADEDQLNFGPYAKTLADILADPNTDTPLTIGVFGGWVQNELARAQAKGKPIFPLLLEGDCWLAVQATQYADVRGGHLPPEGFYERLRKVICESDDGPQETGRTA